MRKEVIIAIILGFALGLVITFGVWTANKALKDKDSQSTAEEVSPISQTTPTISPAVFSLSILSPEDQSVQDKNKITLTGTTEPGSQVIIISQLEEDIVETDASGKFSSNLTLDTGTNQITVTAVNQDGDEATKNIDVVYLAQ
ncbi:MAG: hypothetical protein Q8P25_02485 [Candidatus Curtissbacteria bacterium]|nr:hypothetical protein [Candidatus Curtissbacteria bacterium]MDZ4209650.1 hypothetical protein [Candidatus Curtissbacteria bacterium]